MKRFRDAKTPVKITLLPFYGGAKGQTLQITETVDGTVTTTVINTPLDALQSEETTTTELENPELPARQEPEYGLNLKNIHRAALSIIKIQEDAKKNGLSSTDEDMYRKYMESLNRSAETLTRLYEEDDEDDVISNRAGLSSWFARKKTSTSKKDKKKDEDKKKKEEEDKKKKEEDEKKRKKEDEEKKKREEEERKKKEESERKRKEEEEKKKESEKNKIKEEDEDDEDAVAVNLPPEEASVAEAKPVGLAVAGIGGVAASKPIATAVVGPGGLAVARPVGTAIAGVSPDQALVPIYAEGFIVPSRGKHTNKNEKTKPIHSTEYLNKIISKYHQA